MSKEQYKKDLAAVKQNGWDLMHVKKQTHEICLAAVKQNGWALEFVINQTPEICLAAIMQHEDSVYYLKDIVSFKEYLSSIKDELPLLISHNEELNRLIMEVLSEN